MNSEERFKKSLQEMLDSKDFSFDEANWEKARNMIDAAKNRRRRSAALFISGILLLGLVAGGTYFIHRSNHELAVVSTELKILPEKTGHTNETASDKKISPDKKSTSTAPSGSKESGELVIDSEPKTALRENTGTPISSANNSEPLKPAPEKTSPEVPKDVPQESVSSIPVYQTRVAKKESESKAPDTENTALPAGTDLKKGKKSSVTVASPDTKLPADATDESKDSIYSVTVNTVLASFEQFATDDASEYITQAKKEATKELLADEKYTVTQNIGDEHSGNEDISEIAAVKPALEKESEAEQAVGESFSEKKEVFADSPEKANMQTGDENKDLANSGEDLPASVVKADSLGSTGLSENEIPADNDQGELGRPKNAPTLFSVEAGANYMFGWKNPETRDAKGFNPVFGINYFNYSIPKIAISFGLHYSSVTNLNYSRYTSRVTRLALGEESQVTIFTPVKVHYLIVPLRLNYELGMKNNLGIGCNVAYLLNVESNIESHKENVNGTYDQTYSKAIGYTEGFTKYDLQVSAFYQRKLYPNLGVNVEFFYGLTDIKTDGFFDSNLTERNTGIKLTLVYNFLKK
jgi:hypothetical protein